MTDIYGCINFVFYFLSISGLLIILLSFAIKIHIKLSSENNTMKGGITPRSRQVEMVAGAPAKEHDVYIKSYQYQRIDVDERANA